MEVISGAVTYTGGFSMLYSCFALAGVSSFAPSAIQRFTKAICDSCNGSAFCGISTLPFASGVMSLSKLEASGLPATMATSSSPPFSKAVKSVMM